MNYSAFSIYMHLLSRTIYVLPIAITSEHQDEPTLPRIKFRRFQCYLNFLGNTIGFLGYMWRPLRRFIHVKKLNALLRFVLFSMIAEKYSYLHFI